MPDFLTLNANGNITVNNNPVTVGTYSTTVRFNGSTNLTAGVQININDDVFQVNNEAFKLGDNNYRLTEASANKRGEVWRTTPVDLSKSFEISFKANLGTADGGADGIAFALQRHGSNPLFAYGATGEGLGVGHGSSTTNPRSGGISPSVVVEFDTWQNTEVNNAAIEPNYDHLAIFLSGEERTPVREIEGNATSPWTVKPMKGTASAPVNVEDGVDHLVRIIWDKDTKKMSVYFDNSLRTSYTADLVKTVFGDDPIVYFGYSASTGSSVNQHIVSEINFTPLDIDGDGIANSTDMDSDNDGISNTAESGGADPFADHNADDLANYKDPVYAASVGSSLNSKGVVASMDKDGDGIINVLDLDSDNDGLPDAVEANNGNLPDNMQANGQYPASFVTGTTDVNRNGMVDAVQSNALPNGDKDGDGIPNALDLDSDGDGIVDAIEANNGVLPSSMTSVGQYSVAYMFQNDHNWDGISDIVASTPLANGDFDQDGLMNFLDIDADSDGLPDNLEAQAKDGMLAAKKADLNQNGIDDAFDANATGGKALVPVNSGGIESPDFLDLDSDGDSFLDFVEAFDKNKDGKSSDDFLQLAADFRTRSGNSSMYTATKEANGYPAWMAYASDKRLNFLSPKSAIYYRDSDADGLVDLMDTQSYGEEPTGSSVNYAFRSSDLNTPLPVELISFKATPKGSNVALTWATASEKDNDYFLVERSLDGRTFTSVGKVAGNGTTNVMQNYNFMTASAPAGTVYYRLKQVDYNGKSEYSKVISVKAQGAIARAFLAAYPNPTLGKVVLVSADLPAGTATVTLLHVNGRVVFQKQVEVNAGDIELDLAGQAAGVYCIQVQTAAGKGVVRVVKQ
ncbi:lectin-like domain-containing protein [Rufibacter roseolus]|uniref:lectin-like domain-containing protein n=1 Tax=Rufibacter roseolus TaxID=2817375 RepID=UPI001FF071D6|nr:T9SS type A sorting domain-containing protein [Rufibacter roseolus]